MLGSGRCLLDRVLELGPTHVGSAEDIEHGSDVNADVTLECDYLLCSDLNVAVDI